jgi:N-acetylglucosaminyldiphosphoundecaprenol N-acetyl-beta-D-mannosaminyltransferase
MSDLRCQFSTGEPEIKNEEVVKQINKFKPDILFVAYGMKKQEEWIKDNRSKASFGVAIGVGRSFDYYSGDLKRAPKFLRKIGMEWLYSLIKEPKRIKRQVVLPKFIWKILTR